MRLLHFADLHLGVENHGALDPRTGMSTRVGDFLGAFDSIVDRAISEPVDAVLFAGDAFKNRDPSPTIQREFARRIGRLASHQIPIVLLIGNHDLPNSSVRATANEIYEALDIPNVHVCRDIDLLTVTTRSGPLQVVTLPWVTRSRFLGSEQFRLMAEVDLDRAMGQAISGAIKDLASTLDRGLPAVLLAHVSVQGASLGYEQSIMLGRDLTVDLDELHARSFDYVALGHIHRHQTVGTHPLAIYSGSPERIDFGEERETKGYLMVTIDDAGVDRRVASEFVELNTRAFRTLRIEAAGDVPMEAVERGVTRAERDIRGAIVRCYVTVDAGRERAVAGNEVRRLLSASGAFHVSQVVIESESAARARWEIDDESGRDSIAMLRKWVEMKNYDPALAQRVLDRGIELIGRRRQRVEGGAANDG